MGFEYNKFNAIKYEGSVKMDYLTAAALLVVGSIIRGIGDLFRKKGHYGHSDKIIDYTLKGKFDDNHEFHGSVEPRRYSDTYYEGELTGIGRFICALGRGIQICGGTYFALFVISLDGCVVTMGDWDLDSSVPAISLIASIVGVIFGIWTFFYPED